MIVFEARNTKYALKNVRELPRVRKAMKQYRIRFRTCEFTLHPKWRIHVHHLFPVSTHPEYAGELWNFFSLAAKAHLQLGHRGNYRNISPDLVEILHTANNKDWLVERCQWLYDMGAEMPEDAIQLLPPLGKLAIRSAMSQVVRDA